MLDNLDLWGVDSARGPDGEWQVNRRILLIASVVLIVGVVAVFPLRLLPAPWWADSVLHFTSGTAISLFLAGLVPRRDDAIVAVVMVLGVAFEPAEWAFFACELQIPVFDPPECRTITLAEWMMKNDTLKDIALVWVGSFATLVGLGRYR